VKAWCAGDLTDSFDVRDANEHFDSWASPAGKHVARAVVTKDLDLLTATGAKVKRYVDERIAHLNEAHADPPKLAKLTVPTFDELDEAVTMLGTLLKRYYTLLRGGTLATAEPKPQYNWTGAFTVAWLPREDD
jgi:hypothetical protein